MGGKAGPSHGRGTGERMSGGDKEERRQARECRSAERRAVVGEGRGSEHEETVRASSSDVDRSSEEPPPTLRVSDTDTDAETESSSFRSSSLPLRSCSTQV